MTWKQQDVVVEREDGTGSDVLRSARWWEPCCGCRWLSELVTPLLLPRPPDAWTGRLATVGLESSLGESGRRSSRAALSPRFSSQAGLGCSPRPRLTETPAPRNRTLSDLWSLSTPSCHAIVVVQIICLGVHFTQSEGIDVIPIMLPIYQLVEQVWQIEITLTFHGYR